MQNCLYGVLDTGGGSDNWTGFNYIYTILNILQYDFKQYLEAYFKCINGEIYLIYGQRRQIRYKIELYC